ncbi:MAG: ribonuclease HII [bacterium]|nr:ribonuclease HII [bacterium]
MKRARYIIGIDEVGRGPLAGPVYVGAVSVPLNFDWKLVRGVRDSKKLTPRAREKWYKKLNDMRRAGNLNFATMSSSVKMIDRRGIVFSISAALEKCLILLGANPATCEILLDGSLYAPANFTMQKTIIHGDDIEPIISMASIIAKVRRDSLMRKLAVRYPKYGLDSHKGYGTPLHIKAIQRYGLCALHRKSFCGRLTTGLHSGKKSL